MNPPTLERAQRILGVDPFVKEILLLIPGWLRQSNIWCFQHALGHLPNDASLLEIGSFCGLSTVVLLHLKKRIGVTNPLYTCDPWCQPEGPADTPVTELSPLTYEGMQDYVRDSFIRNVSYFSPHALPRSFRMTSDEFFTVWNEGGDRTDVFGHAHPIGGKFAFVYVDGSHTDSVVKRDFENIDPLLVPGGFILFDDSDPQSDGGPSRVADAVEALPKYELIQRAPNAFFRKRS